LVVAAVLGLTTIPGAAPGQADVRAAGTAAQPVHPLVLEAAIQARESFGLASDPALVESLLSGSADVGSAEWGFPTTADEAQELDLHGRARFVQDLEPTVLPFVRALPTFGGVWIDQREGGSLVVMLTRLESDVIAAIDGLMPEGSLGWRAELAQVEHAKLLDAFDRIRVVWLAMQSATVPTAVSVDERHSRLVVDVTPERFEAAQGELTSIEQELGVPVALSARQLGQDLACTGRRACHDPLKAGVQIDKGYWGTGTYRCSMGFHIWVPDTSPNSNPNTQFLTAGHCGYAGSNDWHHGGVGTDDQIGREKATLFDDSYARDIMRVSVMGGVAGDEMSIFIYGEDSEMYLTGASNPVQGEVLCMSLGVSNYVGCGQVASADQSWLSETSIPHRTVHGASIDTFGAGGGFTSIGGDSGSPIYRRLGWDPWEGLYGYVPVGILDHERYLDGSYGGHDIYFAKVKKALSIGDAEIYPP